MKQNTMQTKVSRKWLNLSTQLSRCCRWSVAVLMLTLSLGAYAQKEVSSAKAPVLLLSSHERTASYIKQTMTINVKTNTDFTVTSNADWLSATKKGNKVVLVVSTNFDNSDRTGTVTVATTDGKVLRQVSVTQERSQAADLMTDEGTTVAVASASDNNHQSGADISKTIDGNTGTIYHSTWGGGNVTEDNPAILTYNFANKHIDYVTYVPRTSGSNGNFGKLKIRYKLTGQSDYTDWGDFDFAKSGAASTVYFGDSGLDNVASIQFIVYSGANSESSTTSYASCAEMQFRTYPVMSGDYSVFKDYMLDALKPGTTQADVDGVHNLFLKHLAQQLLDGQYNFNYRLASYPCLLSPQELSEEWSAPGKVYDVTQGVTGIHITPGKIVVAVEGLASGVSAALDVYGWTVPEGSYYNRASYPLHNGVNIINHDKTWDGLAYVNYFSRSPEGKDSAKVHIINGEVNGILTPDKSNNDMDKMIRNATYTTIDLVGAHVHSIWETQALLKYTAGKYRQYINVLDTLITWEHRLLGFEKYGRVPQNKSLAYVNYNYYMYQGGLGVTFKNDTQNRVCSPDNIMKHDDDVVWGLSHEWGHQHQMNPYFCWSGQSEVTNNMNSCYNVLHMGYAGTRVSNGWNSAKKTFITSDDPLKNTNSEPRNRAYQRRSRYTFSEKMLALFTSMQDSVIKSRESDLQKSAGINEAGVEIQLAPYFMLHCYFTQNGKPDYSPDLYESLRQTDTSNDKYAMIASAQNGRHDRYNSLKAAYPNSCWITSNYVTASSSTWQNSVPYIFNYIYKASTISGYNLFPFFDKWAFMRQIALCLGDYGEKYYCMTEEMYNEFKADMDARVASGELKAMDDAMVEAISTANIPHFSTPDIPN
jgi:hypothetical protein